ncbi:MAG: hypothetical protein L6R41_005430, partial [Letrouitia leprolyta]
ILYGASLAGARVAFAMKSYGNALYAGIASSAIIQGVHGYPEWLVLHDRPFSIASDSYSEPRYDPIQRFGDRDCVNSINNIIDKMDTLVNANVTDAIQRLQQVFGLESLVDIRDFARAIAFPLGNPLFYPTYSWQELHWYPMKGYLEFHDFCRNVTIIDSSVSQIDHELAVYTHSEPWTNLGNYAAYIKQNVLPLCPSGDYNSFDCFGTQHPQRWADSAYSIDRSYLYTTCTEFGAYQVAQPQRQNSLVLGTDYRYSLSALRNIGYAASRVRKAPIET